MTARFAAIVLAAALSSAPGASALANEPPAGSARSVRIDDSGTVVVDPVLAMRWQPAGRTASSPLVSASTRVAVQLNLAAFTGQAGRIYMTLPRGAGPAVRASWQTGGTLLAGSLLSGERALVYAGPIAAPVLRDLLDITLEADGNRLQQPETLSFGFEFEVAQ